MKSVEQSRYNIFVAREDGNYTGFNTFSAALGIFKPEIYHFYENINNKNISNLSRKENEYLEILKSTNFIIERGLDEIKEASIFMNSRKHDLTVLGLTIMPTSHCNLSCTYCYEKKYDSTMDDKTKDALLKFAEERIILAKSLEITWYGGEPLLALDTIVDLSKRFIDLSDKYHTRYSAGIITNGILLTKNVATFLRDQCKVNYCQVTLDGGPEVHDQRRPFSKGGAGSFDIILNNIKDVSDILSVNIRINIDVENSDKIGELLDILDKKGIKDNVKMHIGLIEPLGIKAQCPDTISKCLDDDLLPELQVKFYKMATERGFSPQFYLVPANVFGLCAAEIINSFVIEPNGDIQKCWVPVGDSAERVGTVFEGIPTSVNLQKWIGFDPLEIEECRKCKVLPLCWGNCVYRSMQNVDRLHCGMWKYQLENILSQIDDFIDVINPKENDCPEDVGMINISPTFKLKGKCNAFQPSGPTDADDVYWLYEGTREKKRCCTIVCFRCTHLGPISGTCQLGDCRLGCTPIYDPK